MKILTNLHWNICSELSLLVWYFHCFRQRAVGTTPLVCAVLQASTDHYCPTTEQVTLRYYRQYYGQRGFSRLFDTSHCEAALIWSKQSANGPSCHPMKSVCDSLVICLCTCSLLEVYFVGISHSFLHNRSNCGLYSGFLSKGLQLSWCNGQSPGFSSCQMCVFVWKAESVYWLPWRNDGATATTTIILIILNRR